MQQKTISTTCCIVGGGPAGIFLGYLLARAGVQVVVLEKHADFLRDFRGDTIHPSTLQLLDELGLLEKFLPLLDYRAEVLKVSINGQSYDGPDFSCLKTKCPFIGFVPQWDLLNFLAQQAKALAEFQLHMATEAVEVLREAGRVSGVRCRTENDQFEIRADLVVACDGRSSTMRACSPQPLLEIGIPIDALWFRLDRPRADDGHTIGWLHNGHMLVTIPRRSHYQVALVIQKGGLEALQKAGLPAFRSVIGSVCPPLQEVAKDLKSWDDVKLLTVQLNRLEKWFEEGLLFIGDAAHAMSPVGGVGINLAIQDAVATANRLTAPLLKKSVTIKDLAAVQSRREPATRKTQRMQRLIHGQLFSEGKGPGKPFAPAWYLRLLVPLLSPILRRFAAHRIGLGFQPEHIESLKGIDPS